MATPKFRGPDGVLREEYIFTTDISFRFFTGTMDVNTVDMQVSIREAAFTADPDVILFDGTSFTIPNPSAYPNGLGLLPGSNEILVRSILSNGETTNSASAQAILSLDRDVQALVIAPSGISVERDDHMVIVYVEGIEDPNVVGYHFYASVSPGGGTTGYYRLNTEMVTSGDIIEDTSALGELTVDSTVATDLDGSAVADPLYFRVHGSQVDRFDTVIEADFNEVIAIPESVSRFKTTLQVDALNQITQYSFTHDRRSTSTSTQNPAIPNSEFLAIPETDPLYYVVTAVYLINGAEYESVFSPEVAAAPLIVTPAITQLPVVTHQQIVQDTVLSIYRTQPELDIKPGTVLRDTFIEPFATEAERIRFIIGFLQAAQSFATLLTIDDPGNTGEPVPVTQSAYKLALKQAFYLRTSFDVQNMIDNAFDQLAARRGVVRSTGSRSRGELTCYTTTRPNTTRSIVIGQQASGGGVSFRATSPGDISPSGAGSSYDPSTGRYSITVFLQAEQPGTAGNLAKSQINTLVDGPPGVLCTNSAATFGGRDEESNRELAVRADGLLSAVDSGRYRGYTQLAINTPGVLQVNVVDAGHPLMQRDWDTDLQRHTGGKVDIWIRGENLAKVTDSFAFKFNIVQAADRFGQFEPVGNIQNLKFRAVNPSLTDDNPIIEMLDKSEWGFEFTDETTGRVFDLTDVTILPPDGIQLSSTYNDPAQVSLTDVFRGAYRYRTSDRYVFPRQPVRDVLSLQGDVTGVVSVTAYKLYPGGYPLGLGRSTEAGDYLKVVDPVTGASDLTVPSGEPIDVTGESHVVLEGAEYLNNLGINPLTVSVYTVDRVTEFYSPYDPDNDPDYTFVPETGDTPLGFRLTSNSRITTGDTVVVDYSHDENFVVTYRTNSIVSVVQGDVDDERHITADVVTKEAIPVGVDITATIVMTKGSVQNTVDGLVRTSLGRLFGALSLGEPLRMSDVINVMDAVQGVSYVNLPLIKMAKSDTSIVVREEIPTADPANWSKITGWSSDVRSVYILKTPLESGTINSGGASNDVKGVFGNDDPFTLYETTPNFNGIPIKNANFGAFIIGNDGIDIPGYTGATARRTLVCLPASEDPSSREYTVTYTVYSDTGVKNIEPGPTEYLILGDLEFAYDEDTDFRARVTGAS